MDGTKLIELQDGTLIEVLASANDTREIAGSLAEKVTSSLQKIQSALATACRPILQVCADISGEACVEHAEVELGLSFEAEGNIYITKTKGAGNLTVKFILKPNIGAPKT